MNPVHDRTGVSQTYSINAIQETFNKNDKVVDGALNQADKGIDETLSQVNKAIVDIKKELDKGLEAINETIEVGKIRRIENEKIVELIAGSCLAIVAWKIASTHPVLTMVGTTSWLVYSKNNIMSIAKKVIEEIVIQKENLPILYVRTKEIVERIKTFKNENSPILIIKIKEIIERAKTFKETEINTKNLVSSSILVSFLGGLIFTSFKSMNANAADSLFYNQLLRKIFILNGIPMR